VQRIGPLNIIRREVNEIIKDIEGIENHCFHQILSTADASVFAQIPYICAKVLPFTFQELGQIPWNSSQLTKEFLVKYADLICVAFPEKVNNISHRLYNSHPGLFDFISNPVRAGVYHQFVRSHFIRIINEAMQYGPFSSESLWDDGSAQCVSLSAFHYELNDFLFKDVPLNLNV